MGPKGTNQAASLSSIELQLEKIGEGLAAFDDRLDVIHQEMQRVASVAQRLKLSSDSAKIDKADQCRKIDGLVEGVARIEALLARDHD